MLARSVLRLISPSKSTTCKNLIGCKPAWLATLHIPSWQPNLLQETRRHSRQASSSSSSTRWKNRQSKDSFAREAKLSGLKSRAAFKLLEINAKYHIFARGQTVVDLGYAPGSWSQVAVNRTSPGGRVIGIDVIPAQPPKGASSIQGNFLSGEVREEVRLYVQNPMHGRARPRHSLARRAEDVDEEDVVTERELEEEGKGVVEHGKHMDDSTSSHSLDPEGDSVGENKQLSQKELDEKAGRVVDVVLSDMCEPWPLVANTWVKSVSNPYRRMMNTSGMAFRDHAGSMDLCLAALNFSYDTLITGGHFLCKFYAGDEDKALEIRLKRLFEKVYRIKPDSSRKESKEAYLVALRRKADVAREDVLGDA